MMRKAEQRLKPELVSFCLLFFLSELLMKTQLHVHSSMMMEMLNEIN